MKADRRCGCVWWIRKEIQAAGEDPAAFFSSFIGEFMNKRNYQKELEKTGGTSGGGGCRRCFSIAAVHRAAVMFWNISPGIFEITVFYYNPNIYPPSEYEERTSEQERLIREFNGEWENEANRHPIHFVAGTYVPDDFYTAAKGLEQEPEGGARCTECFKLRLSRLRGRQSRRVRFLYNDPHDQPVKRCGAAEPDRGRDGKRVRHRISAVGFKKKTDISDPRSSPENTRCTGRITAGACSRRERRRRGPAQRIGVTGDQYKTPFFSVRSITPVSKSQSRQEKSFGQVWR